MQNLVAVTFSVLVALLVTLAHGQSTTTSSPDCSAVGVAQDGAFNNAQTCDSQVAKNDRWLKYKAGMDASATFTNWATINDEATCRKAATELGTPSLQTQGTDICEYVSVVAESCPCTRVACATRAAYEMVTNGTAPACKDFLMDRCNNVVRQNFNPECDKFTGDEILNGAKWTPARVERVCPAATCNPALTSSALKGVSTGGVCLTAALLAGASAMLL